MAGFTGRQSNRRGLEQRLKLSPRPRRWRLEGVGIRYPYIGAALARWSDTSVQLSWGTADALFRLNQAPGELELVRTVALTSIFEDDDVAYNGLLNLERRNRIRTLDLSCRPEASWRLGGERLARLIGAPQFTAVQVLKLDHAGLDGAALAAIPKASFAHGLRELDLSHNAVGGGLALAAPGLPRLQVLGLQGTGLGPADVAALGGIELPLRSLNLGDNPALDEVALAPLADAPFCTTLRQLTLGGTASPLGGLLRRLADRGCRLETLTVRGSPLGAMDGALSLLDERTREVVFEDVAGGDGLARALAESAGSHALRRLELVACDVGDAGAFALAGAGGFAGLEALDLGRGRVTAAGLRALLGGLGGLRHLSVGEAKNVEGDAHLLNETGPISCHLESLDLSGNAIGPQFLGGLRALGVTVQRLGLQGCGLGADGLAPLLDGALFGWLASEDRPSVALILDGNPIGDEGAIALLESGVLGRLETLSMVGCGLTDRSARRIAGWRAPLDIEFLVLEDNEITPEGFEALAKSEALQAEARYWFEP